MRRILTVLAVVVASVGSTNAQDQIATVTSNANFQLRGANVTPGQGIPSWPVLSGDAIKPGTAPAVITFPDGSLIMLESNSMATVSMSGSIPTFDLASGSATYSLKSLTAVQLVAGNRTINPTSLTGSFGAGAHGFWTPVHTTLVVVGGVGGATAAALAAGAAVANTGGPQVSPSH
jgi:hypothetical protein